MDTVIRRSIDLAGRTLTLETGHLAKQASGSVLVRYGDTVVLVTATGSQEPREGIDFFPLTVDFEEKMYAAGKVPGSFLRREGRASEQATLSARLIDRPIRPLFPKGYRNDVQIVATVLCVEPDNPPDMAAMIGASCALHLSHIPFQGPIAGVHVGYVDGEIMINPNQAEREVSSLDLAVAGTHDAIMMVEAGAQEVSEAVVLEGILEGHKVIAQLTDLIEDMRREALEKGIAKEKIAFEAPEINEAITDAVKAEASDALRTALQIVNKKARDEAIQTAKSEALAVLSEQFEDSDDDIIQALDALTKAIVRRLITHDKIRPDGRALNEVRPLTCEVDLLPRTHGSAVFTRGQTQILSVTTLGSSRDSQPLDGLDDETSRRYLHHYNFPPYSVGETRPIRGPGRREIGHGVLARRALEPVIPSLEEFPYMIRVVSEAIESNGSTSMASVCGSTMSLMAAGVPIRKPVSGVAMGLIREEDQFSVLTDLQGLEDALGDMDFKVAGTVDGITAIQMDIKIDGINKAILEQALAQAKEGRLFILDTMLKCINAPRESLSPYAPRIESFKIDVDKIKDVIGSGGKTIKKIIETTGVQIDVEEDGTVNVLSSDAEACNQAVEMIQNIVKDPEVGEIYTGKVVRIMDFGAFVNILPGKDGLVHISQLDKKRVNKVEDVVKVGDEVTVKVIEIDRMGRINLSRKALLD
ncbi:polyribonucleotide nucleotidyltransferase [Peptococcus niger]|uniref:Polyribonucleotide nucleotidyltransferase n=1 Tax=Peptococcus niger TaxID=2741 RepID=A0A1G6RUD9_PEPNI|nr:polyribonucleotide nucleotidyltransferase [Peptococcus niger]SDD07555.1 polyribonucleotide nucleotidyltransferase [Peptococcus niger]